jgi:hypothetical protein
MTVISERIVVSKYKAYHSLLNKKIDFNRNGCIVKNIIQHKELVKDIKSTVIGDHVDITVKLGTYYTYCLEENGENTEYSTQMDEEIFIRVYKKSFKPVPYETDFCRCEITALIRNINAVFDIGLNYDSISINICAFVIVNLSRERCIEVEDKNKKADTEYFFNQVAVSSDTEVKDAKNYFSNLENYSKVISKKIDELEEENNFCREELKRLEGELSRRTDEYLDAVKKFDNEIHECERLKDRLRDMEEKYLKEQKKANLLEIENSRNIDELKVLRKEKSALLQKINQNKTSFKDKIKQIINGEDKQ